LNINIIFSLFTGNIVNFTSVIIFSADCQDWK